MYKDMGEGALALCLMALIVLAQSSFTTTQAYFFGIPAYTEDELRHSVLCTDQILNCRLSIQSQALLD